MMLSLSKIFWLVIILLYAFGIYSKLLKKEKLIQVIAKLTAKVIVEKV